MENKKALVVFSGGMDSTVAVYWALKNYREVETLSFNYNSKHNNMEYQYALKTCEKLGLKNTRIDLDFINKYFKSDLLQSGGAIPEGHYAADNMKSTVVPFRNGIMLAIAAGFAESQDCDVLVLGNHSGDHCFTKDTKILTPQGLKTYEELNINDDVYSFNLQENKWELDKVVNKFPVQEVQVINEIETHAGNIKLTSDHKVYRLKLGEFNNRHGYTKTIEKVKVKDLTIGDYLVQPTSLIKKGKISETIDLRPIIETLITKYEPQPKLFEEDDKLWINREASKDLAIPRYINAKALVNVLAWYIAEGHSRKDCYTRTNNDGSKYRSEFSQSLKANLDKVELIRNNLENAKIPAKFQFSKKIHNNIPQEMTIYMSNISAVLAQSCGCFSYEKHIPDWLMDILLKDFELREEFLFTIGLGDGFNTETRYKGFCTTSDTLLEQMITLIQLSGYHFTKHKRKYKTHYITYSNLGVKSALISLGEAKFTEIKDIREIEHNDWVYDITVKNNHNFLAGEFGQLLISNCIYPDCRPSFIEGITQAIKEGTAKNIEVISPFCNINKTDICRLGQELGVDFSLTYSCYKGGEKHCGKCGTCTERIEAFKDSGVPDPTIYENKGEENV